MAAEPGRTRRSKLALSLRITMLAVVLFATWLGWLTHLARVQRRTIETVKSLNGLVFCNDERVLEPSLIPEDVRLKLAKQTPKRGWLRRMIGDEYFHDIAYVNLRAGDATTQLLQAAIDTLSESPRLDRLLLYGAGFNTTKLNSLGNCTSLRYLSLSDLDLRGMDLSWLARLKNLEYLDLTSSSIENSTLAAAAPLTRLKGLYLSWPNNAGITDAGLSHLKGLTQLEDLALSAHAGFGKAAIVHLADLKSLKRVDLWGTCVDDLGISNIRTLPALTYLDLTGTKITDSGLATIAALSRLKIARVGDTSVTKNGVKAFHQARPDFVYLSSSHE